MTFIALTNNWNFLITLLNSMYVKEHQNSSYVQAKTKSVTYAEWSSNYLNIRAERSIRHLVIIEQRQGQDYV